MFETKCQFAAVVQWHSSNSTGWSFLRHHAEMSDIFFRLEPSDLRVHKGVKPHPILSVYNFMLFMSPHIFYIYQFQFLDVFVANISCLTPIAMPPNKRRTPSSSCINLFFFNPVVSRIFDVSCVTLNHQMSIGDATIHRADGHGTVLGSHDTTHQGMTCIIACTFNSRTTYWDMSQA